MEAWGKTSKCPFHFHNLVKQLDENNRLKEKTAAMQGGEAGEFLDILKLVSNS